MKVSNSLTIAIVAALAITTSSSNNKVEAYTKKQHDAAVSVTEGQQSGKLPVPPTALDQDSFSAVNVATFNPRSPAVSAPEAFNPLLATVNTAKQVAQKRPINVNKQSAGGAPVVKASSVGEEDQQDWITTTPVRHDVRHRRPEPKVAAVAAGVPNDYDENSRGLVTKVKGDVDKKSKANEAEKEDFDANVADQALTKPLDLALKSEHVPTLHNGALAAANNENIRLRVQKQQQRQQQQQKQQQQQPEDEKVEKEKGQSKMAKNEEGSDATTMADTNSTTDRKTLSIFEWIENVLGLLPVASAPEPELEPKMGNEAKPKSESILSSSHPAKVAPSTISVPLRPSGPSFAKSGKNADKNAAPKKEIEDDQGDFDNDDDDDDDDDKDDQKEDDEEDDEEDGEDDGEDDDEEDEENGTTAAITTKSKSKDINTVVSNKNKNLNTEEEEAGEEEFNKAKVDNEETKDEEVDYQELGDEDDDEEVDYENEESESEGEENDDKADVDDNNDNVSSISSPPPPKTFGDFVPEEEFIDMTIGANRGLGIVQADAAINTLAKDSDKKNKIKTSDSSHDKQKKTKGRKQDSVAEVEDEEDDFAFSASSIDSDNSYKSENDRAVHRQQLQLQAAEEARRDAQMEAAEMEQDIMFTNEAMESTEVRIPTRQDSTLDDMIDNSDNRRFKMNAAVSLKKKTKAYNKKATPPLENLDMPLEL